MGSGTVFSKLIADGGLFTNPIPTLGALKKETCCGKVGVIVGIAASAMLVVDSGNREGGYGGVDE